MCFIKIRLRQGEQDKNLFLSTYTKNNFVKTYLKNSNNLVTLILSRHFTGRNPRVLCSFDITRPHRAIFKLNVMISSVLWWVFLAFNMRSIGSVRILDEKTRFLGPSIPRNM